MKKFFLGAIIVIAILGFSYPTQTYIGGMEVIYPTSGIPVTANEAIVHVNTIAITELELSDNTIWEGNNFIVTNAKSTDLTVSVEGGNQIHNQDNLQLKPWQSAIMHVADKKVFISGFYNN